MKHLLPLRNDLPSERARLRIEREHLERMRHRLVSSVLAEAVKLLDGPPEGIEATFGRIMDLREAFKDVAARLVEVERKLGGKA